MNEIQISQQKTFEITSFEQAERFATMFSNSDFAPREYKGKPANVLIAMQLGNELGIKPMQALQNISVINGRPTVWGDLALALVRAHRECMGVKEWIDGSVKDGTAIAHCEVTRNNEVIKESFSIEQAKRASLWGKQGTWSQYPERMLTMRARGFALRNAFPDALKGLYLQEEMEGSSLQFKTSVHNSNLGSQAVKNAMQSNNETIIEIPQDAETIDSLIKMIETSSTIDDLKYSGEVIRSSNLNEATRISLGQLYKEKMKELKEKPIEEETEILV